MSPPQNLVENAVKEIRNDVKHDRGLDAIREELNKLEQAHADDKNPAALKADLRQVGEMLHKQGILPRVDFVATSEGDAVLLGISGDGKADGHGQRLTAVRGMTLNTIRAATSPSILPTKASRSGHTVRKTDSITSRSMGSRVAMFPAT